MYYVEVDGGLNFQSYLLGERGGVIDNHRAGYDLAGFELGE